MPEGSSSCPSRFVVLRHEPGGVGQVLHWDVMLECDGVLWTWSTSQEWRSCHTFIVERLPDHRLAYLDYQGPISGGRGRVDRVDGGSLEWLEQSPFRIKVQLIGAAWRGTLIVAGNHGQLVIAP